MTFRRYGVSRREPIVNFILAALETCGAKILEPPNPRSAPFEMTIETLVGEPIQLICYAFLANKYGQRNRPEDEHRFQIKYGSDFSTYHKLYIAPGPSAVTLMFGVHLEEGLFVAIDPQLHQVTWFSRSVEFKTNDLEEAKRSGWHGWERDRSSARRKRIMPLENLQTESLLALTPENFLRYVYFERLATGMDTGERLLLAQRMLHRATPSPIATRHPLEIELGLSAHDILDIIGGAFRLKAAVRGGVAEHHLGEFLRTVPGMAKVTPIDEDKRPDFEVLYRGRLATIECKNVLRQRTAKGFPRVDFQKTRASKSDPCSRYYKPTQFDVLAACLHPVVERWEFQFCSTASLPRHPVCHGHLSPNVEVNGQNWTSSIGDLLEQVAR